jgi:anti-sigma B factor antagonist
MDQTIASGPPRGNPTSSTLKMAGELDLAAAPLLQEELEALFTSGATSIVVDLLDATFLDSTALGVLVNALNRCQELGGQLHLIVTEPQILRVLDITGLTNIFSILSNSDELASDKEKT